MLFEPVFSCIACGEVAPQVTGDWKVFQCSVCKCIHDGEAGWSLPDGSDPASNPEGFRRWAEANGVEIEE